MFNTKQAFSTFSVNNLQQAKDFYATTLKLPVEELPMGLLEIQLNPGMQVVVYEKKDHQPAGFTILNFPVRDIETVVKELKTKGIHFEHYEEPIATDENGICSNGNGPKIAWFKDPFGNILSVLEEKKIDKGDDEKEKLVRDFNKAIEEENMDLLLDCVTQDISWKMIGAAPLKGKKDLENFFNGMKGKSVTGISLGKLIINNNTAVLEGEIRVIDEDGRERESSFCDLYTFSKTPPFRISELRAYVIDISKSTTA